MQKKAPRYREESPIMEINTTPLIDVLLVLLIMFIITIPLQSHAVKLELPSGPPPAEILRTKNMVVITSAGAILWNGAPISLDGLRHNLALTTQIVPNPELHLQPDSDARYALVDEVLAVTKRTGVGNVGFVGNERYSNF
jgi:biopolymer transport protein ExbD